MVFQLYGCIKSSLTLMIQQLDTSIFSKLTLVAQWLNVADVI